MCLDIVTRENVIAKSDMVVWKKVFDTDDGCYHSLFAASGLCYDNEAQDLYYTSSGRFLARAENCKPGICVFKRRYDAEKYMGRRHCMNIGMYSRLSYPKIIVIKCIIPKGTRISHGFDRDNVPVIVSQRLIIPELES